MRWASAALVSVCVLLWIDALAGGGLAGAAPTLLLVAALAVLTGLGHRLVHLIIAASGSATLLAVADQVRDANRFSIASEGIFYAVVVVGPALAGWLIGSRNRQLAELRTRRQHLGARREALVRAAVAREHEHVARRVDHVLAERLRAIVADASALGGAADRDVATGLETIELAARGALAELRGVLGTLRNPGTIADLVITDIRTGPERKLSKIVDVLLAVAVVPLAIETALPGHRGWWWLNVLAALAQAVALILIRRRPIVGAALLVALALAQTAFLASLPSTVSWFLPGLLAAFLVSFGATLPTAVVGLVVLSAGVSLMALVAPDSSGALHGLVPGLVMGVLTWGVGRVAAARDRRARELTVIADELDRTAAQAADLAAVEQRVQVARDLHDVGAHALTVICLQAGAARTWWERDRDHAQPALESVLAVARGPIAQLSTSLARLVHDDPSDQFDTEALEALAGLSRTLGLDVAVTIIGRLDQLSAELAQVTYRIIQEALTNAARHAGPTDVQVHLAVADDAIEVRVVDGGRDPSNDRLLLPTTGSGLGLRGMRERVEAMRGELTAGPLGEGFQVLARMPT
jgi:signal transduction histidine kinase